jgi:hypothetical protein
MCYNRHKRCQLANRLPMLLQLPQVYLTASANVTVGYVFNGITPRDDLKWVPKHLAFFDQTMTGVMRGVGSDMAGGYDEVCHYVTYVMLP